MKYIYTKKDLDLISWERIDSFIDKIYKVYLTSEKWTTL